MGRWGGKPWLFTERERPTRRFRCWSRTNQKEGGSGGGGEGWARISVRMEGLVAVVFQVSGSSGSNSNSNSINTPLLCPSRCVLLSARLSLSPSASLHFRPVLSLFPFLSRSVSLSLCHVRVLCACVVPSLCRAVRCAVCCAVSRVGAVC